MEHHVVGARLQVSPAELFVPKSIPGSLAVTIAAADGTTTPELAAAGQGAHIEAVLRGPAFPAYRLLGFPNEPLVLPPIPLSGEYQIDDIRMVNTETGETLMMGSPSRVPVTVFPEVLVSRVESRRLSLDEIVERGIVIDNDSFSALEFQATFLVAGEPVPVRFPVVSPKWSESIEIIPAAEVEERLVEAERMNRALVQTVELPPELDLPGLDIQMRGLNFQRVPTGLEEEERSRQVPTIPGMVVIPGNVGFLNQFFSVQVFTANASPVGSGLSVHSLDAELLLPPGGDQQLGTDDDPLRVARVGPDAVQSTRVRVGAPGADGQVGTADDIERLQPGQTGQAEFLVEGLDEGLHEFDIRLTGTLDGFAQGEVEIEGRALGAVMVRNPRFSLAITHPRTIRVDDEYTAAFTVLNTSETPAELVSVSLASASLSGSALAPGQASFVDLGTILPGESATAEFQLISQRTGYVTMTNLMAQGGLSGRFDFSLGVDERMVPLSPGIIGYPSYVSHLPSTLRTATERVLGQALSVSTAATLPPGVRKITPETVRRRVVELAEAGQRLQYGDDPARVYLDLLLDWHGGRWASRGFDQILRETEAGTAFRTAVAELATAGATGPAPLHDWVEAAEASLAGLGQAWLMASAGGTMAEALPRLEVNGVRTDSMGASIEESGVYGVGASNPLVLLRAPSSRAGTREVVFEVAAGASATSVTWWSTEGEGAIARRRWTTNPDPTLAICYRVSLDAPDVIHIDEGCDRSSDRTPLSVTPTIISELAPQLVAVEQDLTHLLGRPNPYCGGPVSSGEVYDNYGTVVAVLFDKPMDLASLEVPGAVQLAPLTEAGIDYALIGSNGVALQPGGRVALLNFDAPIGDLLTAARVVEFAGVTDVRGNLLVADAASRTITPSASAGVIIHGRVVAADGSLVSGVPVTLTMHDRMATPKGCVPVDVRISQVFSDAEGLFTFDYVPSGVPYTIATTDTRRLGAEATSYLLEASADGTLDRDALRTTAQSPEDVAAFARAFETTDVAGAIAIAEDVDRAVFSDFISNGSLRVGGVARVALRFRGRATVRGVVLRPDGVTPAADAAVNLFPDVGSRELGRGVFTDSLGRFEFRGVPIGPYSVRVETSDQLQAIVAGSLVDPGAQEDLTIVLTSSADPTGDLAGVVREADGVTPHPAARVVIEIDGVGAIALVEADANGHFRVENIAIPAEARFDLTAVSSDGLRVGQRNGLALQASTLSYADITLPGSTTVSGQVLYSDGSPVVNAVVAGGATLVNTDVEGRFLLDGVPTGSRTISAGISSAQDPAVAFPRVGSTDLDVRPGAVNYALVVIEPAGAIVGQVTDTDGSPVTGINVAVPSTQGFYWVPVDDQGNYRIENLRLGSYTVSAPAPRVVDVAGVASSIASGNVDQLHATLGSVFRLGAALLRRQKTA